MFFMFLFGCDSAEIELGREALAKSEIVFSISNQSTTPYLLPKSPYFKKGDFDITRVELRDWKDDYILIIEMKNNFRNSLGMPGNWDNQVFDIYLFSKFGKNKMALQNRRVKFNKPWAKAVLVSPLRYEALRDELEQHHRAVYDDKSDIEDLYPNVYVADRIKVIKNTIYVLIPKSELRNVIENLEGIQVLVSSVDSNSKVSIREVFEHATRWHFGGGSYSKNHPNVVSILGVNDLLSYSKEITKRVYASIEPIVVGGR